MRHEGILGVEPAFNHGQSNIIHALADCMGQSVFWEANMSSAREEVPCMLRNSKVHYSFQNNQFGNEFEFYINWLRHCATSLKAACSIPDGVIGIFHWHNPSGRTMTLGWTQPLTEMSTRNISWGGKGCWCVGLTTLPPSCAEYLEIWEPQFPGALSACPGL